ncbi:bacillolysin [Polaribacter filamentus]|uniref:Bacillolysin n=1 Tax=Polaribacter filamentus TaxID=53483 RepID=A0A2S7KU55_9FLAO|nr:M4 family metallopeptidase [Polaribacter filamentus]PQB06169.1 bacillolysin [Polaribacter filamentus]
MKKSYLLLIAFIFTIYTSKAQDTASKAIADLQATTQAIVTLNKNLQTPGFIKFPMLSPYRLEGNTIKAKVNSFLNTYKSIYTITDVDASLKDAEISTDVYGLQHFVLKQYYKGVPVFDAELKFHFNKNEDLNSINGNIISNININHIPSINKNNAGNIALRLLKSQNLNKSGAALKIISNELYLFPKGLAQGYVTTKHLAYRIEIRNDLDVREFLFIDGHSGKLIEQFTGIAHALNRILYEVNTDNKRYSEGGSTFFLSQWQKNEIETAGHVYYFFKNAFGVISYDNNDAQMVTINNNPDIDCPNATWNGVSANYCDGTASDDVVAHEWGHAYNQYTANLIYSYESGALNESFSDIWGETIDLLNNYQDDGEDDSVRTGSTVTNRWQMGEDATAFGGAIRDMWDPTIFGHPSNVTGSDYWCETGDNGGVHMNSGIPNHAYALIVDGGSFNGQTITGLGFTKAAHIFWRAQSQYLTQTSRFSAFADAIEASTNDLIGIALEGLSTTETAAGTSGQSITTSDYDQVVKALIAVELRTENNCTFATILSANEEICGASASNPIFQEDWESGVSEGWIITQLPENTEKWEAREWVLRSNLPKEREGIALYAPNPANGLEDGGNCDTQNGIIRLESRSISIPDYTDGIFELAFTHNIASEPAYDGGNIKYSLDAGTTWAIIPGDAFTVNAYNTVLTADNDNNNPMVEEEVFSGVDENSVSSIWGQSVINLSSLGLVANSSIKLRWEFGSDGCNGNDGWYIDDIVIYNCSQTLSINDIDFLNKNINIYPNPSQGIFNIEMKNISDFHYEIFDISGKSITNKIDVTLNSFEINLSNYSKGIYFLKLQSNEEVITKKLIIK